MPRATRAEDPIVFFSSQQYWEKWLAEEHARSSGVWLKIARKGTGIDSVDYAQALDVALCYGWIDGQKEKLDDEHWLQRFTPRKRGGKWSKVNCAKVEELIKQRRMAPAGMREVEQAKADGRWDAAYASQSEATVPDDLQRALDADERAKEFFATLDSRNRYAILYRVQDAKKPETRAQRIEKFVAMLRKGEKIHP